MTTKIEPDHRLKLIEAFSDDKVADWLGLPLADVPKFRLTPGVYLSDKNISVRLDSLADGIVSGTLKTDEEENFNLLTRSLQFINKTPLKPVMDLLAMYDRNIAAPTTGYGTYLLDRLLPGDQKVKSRADELVRKGVRFDRALVQAFDESDLPGWVKFGLRFFLDPSILAMGVGKVGGLFARGAAIAPALTVARKVPALSRLRNKITDLPDVEVTGVTRPILNWTNKSKAVARSSVDGVDIGKHRLMIEAEGYITTTKLSLQGLSPELFGKGFNEAINDARQMLRSENISPQLLDGVEELGSFVPKNNAFVWTGTVGLDKPLLRSEVFKEMKDMLKDGALFKDKSDYLEAILRVSYETAVDKQVRNSLKILAPRGRVTTGKIGRVKGFKTSVEFVDKIEKTMRAEGIGVLEPFSKVNDAVRTFRTQFDVGALFIQGLPLLFKSPTIWAKTTALSFKSLADPLVLSKYVRQNASQVADFIQHGGVMNSPEILQSLQRGGYMAKVLKVTPIRKLYEPFQRSFETYLDIGKFETWKALEATARRSNSLPALAAHVNKLTGTINSTALGIGTKQRQLERAIFFFSPQYLRAIVGLMVDAFQGGLRGNEARKAFGSLIFGSAAFHAAFAEMLGQEPNFDPSSSGFEKVIIGGSKVGFGGKTRNLMRLLGEIASKPTSELPDYFHWNLLDAETYQDNPLAQWLRSGSSPGAGIALSLILGEDAIGRDIPEPTEDLVDFVAYLGRSQLPPFWLATVFETALMQGQLTGPSLLVGGAGEAAGLTVSPLTERDKLKLLQTKLAKEAGVDSWDKLPGNIQNQIKRSHPELVDQIERKNVEARKFNSSRRRIEYYEALDKAEAVKVKDLQNAAAEYLAGGSGRTFREDVSKAAEFKAKTLMQTRLDFADEIKSFEEWQERPEVLEDRLPYDLALDEYTEKVWEAITVTGRADYKARERNKMALRKKWGDEIIDAIEQDARERKRFSTQGEIPPEVIDLYNAKERLAPYWQVYKTMFTDDKLRLYEEYEAATNIVQAEMEATNGRLRALITQVRNKQGLMRLQDVEIDEALVKFYDYSPLHPKNRIKYRK